MDLLSKSPLEETLRYTESKEGGKWVLRSYERTQAILYKSSLYSEVVNVLPGSAVQTLGLPAQPRYSNTNISSSFGTRDRTENYTVYDLSPWDSVNDPSKHFR